MRPARTPSRHERYASRTRFHHETHRPLLYCYAPNVTHLFFLSWFFPHYSHKHTPPCRSKDLRFARATLYRFPPHFFFFPPSTPSPPRFLPARTALRDRSSLAKEERTPAISFHNDEIRRKGYKSFEEKDVFPLFSLLGQLALTGFIAPLLPLSRVRRKEGKKGDRAFLWKGGGKREKEGTKSGGKDRGASFVGALSPSLWERKLCPAAHPALFFFVCWRRRVAGGIVISATAAA